MNMTFSQIAGQSVFLLGAVVLGGWTFGVPALTTVFPGFAPMKPNAAVCFMLCGAALWLLDSRRWGERGRLAAQAFGGAAALVGIATLCEYALGVDLRLDQFLFRDNGSAIQPDAPGRMARVSAINFTILGLALMEGRRLSWGWLLVHGGAAATACLSLLAIIGYIYRVPSLYGVAGFTAMAVHTAAGLTILSAGVIMTRSSKGILGRITGDTLGGRISRRLLPWALLVPFIVGWLRLQGQILGYYGTEFGIAILAMANSSIFACVVIMMIQQIDRLEDERRAASSSNLELLNRDKVLRGLLADLQKTTGKLEVNRVELKRSNTELEQFAFVASHDLQEPLRMVASYTTLLARRYKGKFDPEADKFIVYIIDGATRMQDLIKDILEYSSIGKKRTFQPTDCAIPLNKALTTLKPAIEGSGAVVSHGPMPTLTVNPMLFAQLFQNLIGNAIKYRGAISPQIQVEAKQSGGEWIFSVRDNGIGFDMEYADRIFVLFQRLHTREEHPGTGIGLAVCKKIVEQHGGRIWVKSKPDTGSTFCFTIPERLKRSARDEG